MTRLWPALVAAAVWSTLAHADDRAHPACDAIVKPDDLSAHSRHPWRGAPGIRLPGDVAVCAYYQDEVPAGLTLAVHEDPERHEFNSARSYFRDVQNATDLRDAYYFRLASTAPFEPSWGLVVHDGKRTYRIEGIPEAGDADAARKIAREIIERTMKVF
ncbi:MAG TPA: hypothetical protein VFB36_17255 [Nevskiaceae bacterium]|nr:hypothetical protein [Nevskiaceae bacterium]